MVALGRSQYPALQASCQENESSPLFVPGYANGTHTECDLLKWRGELLTSRTLKPRFPPYSSWLRPLYAFWTAKYQERLSNFFLFRPLPATRDRLGNLATCVFLFQPPVHFLPPFHPGSLLLAPPPSPAHHHHQLWSLFAWWSAPGEFFSGQSKLKETSIQWFWTPQVSFTIQDSHFIICHLIWIT